MNFKQKRLRIFRELALLLFLFVIFNNLLYRKKIEKDEVVIAADGRGYYEYLPAVFIYHDIHFGYIDTLKTELYDFEQYKTFYQVPGSKKRLNKYYVGTALLQSPFFFIAHSVALSNPSTTVADGFSSTYQRGIWFAAIFYLFIGIYFIRRLLETYEINPWWILFVQLTLIFATPILNYTLYESAFSHIYSFALIACFAFLVRKYFQENNPKHLVFTLIVLGLILITRPVNGVVLFFTPLLADSFEIYLQKIKGMFTTHFKPLLLGITLFVGVISIQLYFSYLQYGTFLYYSYGNETFNFSEPHFIDFLFSYRKGFFLWSPIWFLFFLLGIIYGITRKQKHHTIALLLGFTVLVYILSSWYAWWYCASYGQRPMIDFYAVLILVVVPILRDKNRIGKIILLLLSPALILITQIQIFQYIKAIILWDEMTKEVYWESFLNTDEKYSWYYWRKQLPVGRKQTKVVLYDVLEIIPNKGNTFMPPITKLQSIDSLTKIVELNFQLKETPNLEQFEINLLDSNKHALFTSYNGLFLNQYGDQINCRFNLPAEVGKDVKYIMLNFYNLEKKLTVKRMTLTSYFD